MKVRWSPAPWVKSSPGQPLLGIDGSLYGMWAEAATEYFGRYTAAKAHRTRPPKGMQSFINNALTQRMEQDGWDHFNGRFIKDQAWVRVTFRHQMSLGADILEALKMTRLNDMNEVGIIAAPNELLRVITPNDASALCSVEKFNRAIYDLQGCLDIPLFIGHLEAVSKLPSEVAEVLRSSRPRDVTLPGW